MLRGFKEANVKRHLYVIGEMGVEGRKEDLDIYKRKYSSNYIHFLGKKSNQETISIMKACDYQIHLAFIDICPNIVLEGLACGLKILCTNLGGTPELVKNNGIILRVDKFWKTKYLKKTKDDLDRLKPSIVADGICRLLKLTGRKPVVFDINDTIERYVKVIEDVFERKLK